jgi:hypothetical protein
MGKDPVHNVGRGFTSPLALPLDSAHHATCIAWSLLIEESTTYDMKKLRSERIGRLPPQEAVPMIVSPVPFVLSYDSVCEQALPSPASSRLASGKKSDASLP